MGARKEDLTGLKFNKLTVLNLIDHNKDKTYKKRYWLCLCDCGKQTISATSQIVSGKTKSCGCIKVESSIINSINSRHKIVKKGSGYNSLFNSYYKSAKIKDRPFELSLKDFTELLKGDCFYCGSEPKSVFMKSYYNVIYNGIDRRDNNLGYTLDNSVSCCKMCNISKNNHTENEFKEWIKKAYKNLEKIELNERSQAISTTENTESN